MKATALPIIGIACCNPRMLQGKELAAAIATAMEKKRAVPGYEKIGPTALGKALGMRQPSASDLLSTGRLAKDKLPALLAYFEDVVGPDHFGLPFSQFEAQFLKDLRQLPIATQLALAESVKKAALEISHATAQIELSLGGSGTMSHQRDQSGPLAA